MTIERGDNLGPVLPDPEPEQSEPSDPLPLKQSEPSDPFDLGIGATIGAAP